MAVAPAGKMKRKNIEDVCYDEFSLSAPAIKIRRLDAELPPIVEEEEPPAAPPLVFNQTTTTTTTAPSELMDTSMDGVESMVPLHEERALVLYKPVNNNNHHHLILSPNVPYRVSSDIISGIKNQCFWRGNLARTEEKVPVDDEQVANNSLAVIPWHAPVIAYAGPITDGPSEDMMDAEVTHGASMEIEENVGEAISTGVGEDGFHQQPQHCMIPQLPTNPSTPITWSWG